MGYFLLHPVDNSFVILHMQCISLLFPLLPSVKTDKGITTDPNTINNNNSLHCITWWLDHSMIHRMDKLLHVDHG